MTTEQSAQALEPTDAQIDAWAVAEQFILFADPEDVRDIVRSALHKWGNHQSTQPKEPSNG